LTDFNKIRYGDAHNDTVYQKFQNPRSRTAAILKIEKSQYLENRLAA